jgi:hypothetical protein
MMASIGIGQDQTLFFFHRGTGFTGWGIPKGVSPFGRMASGGRLCRPERFHGVNLKD